MNHDLVAARAAEENIVLLTLCQQLQSEKDGREHIPAMRMNLPIASVPHACTPCSCAGCCL